VIEAPASWPGSPEAGARRIYHLEADPQESADIAGREAVEELEPLLRQLAAWTQADDGGTSPGELGAAEREMLESLGYLADDPLGATGREDRVGEAEDQGSAESPPSLISPEASGRYYFRPRFAWTPVPGAEGYRVWITHRQSDVGVNFLDVREPSLDDVLTEEQWRRARAGPYQWWVAALGEGGAVGAPSERRTFERIVQRETVRYTGHRLRLNGGMFSRNVGEETGPAGSGGKPWRSAAPPDQPQFMAFGLPVLAEPGRYRVRFHLDGPRETGIGTNAGYADVREGTGKLHGPVPVSAGPGTLVLEIPIDLPRTDTLEPRLYYTGVAPLILRDVSLERVE
jgi:hypothetical protein